MAKPVGPVEIDTENPRFKAAMDIWARFLLEMVIAQEQQTKPTPSQEQVDHAAKVSEKGRI